MTTYRKALDEANRLVRIARKEITATKLLMLHFSGLEANELYLKFDEEMPEKRYKDFMEGLSKYIDQNIPVQQIIGYVYFYGYKFIVKNTVLIPRFETEELVANVLMLYDEYFAGKEVDLVDIGTGSGCLAIALKKEEGIFNVVATDISEEALEVAKENAENLEAEIEFLHGDMLGPVRNRKFDILVSNPPYIPEDEKVDEIIYDNEPHVALFGGEDGLKFYRVILSQAQSILKEKSFIAFEHGYDKAKKLRDIAKGYFPEADVFTLKDLQGLDRMTFVINGFEKHKEI